MPTNRPLDAPEADVNRELADRLAKFRTAMETALASLAEPLHVQPCREPAADEGNLAVIRGFLDALRLATSQRQILSALLGAASRCFPRLILFIVRGEALVAWDARNESDEAWPRGDAIEHLTIPAHGDHLPARAIASLGIATSGKGGPGFVLTEALGGTVPGRSAAVPLVVRGRAVALLYGDGRETSDVTADLLFEILGLLGGLALATAGPSRRSRPAGDQRDRSVHAPAGEYRGSRRSAGVLSTLQEFAPSVAPSSGSDGPEADSSAAGPSAPPTGPQAPEEAEMQALLGDVELMRRESSDGGMSPEDRRLHTDARRFASLLISEILLYNEEAVVLGRRNRDLSRRLSKEIEKSRRTFTTRIPDRFADARRYFDEELVRVLAEGDPAALGN